MMFGLSYIKLAGLAIASLLVIGALWKVTDWVALEPRRERDTALEALLAEQDAHQRTAADLKTARTNAYTLESKLAEQNSRWQDFADDCKRKADTADEAARGALEPRVAPKLNHTELNEWLARLLKS